MTTETVATGPDSLQWDAVSAIATVLSTAAFIVSLIFIYRQLWHMRISTMATAFSKALEILQDEARRDDRRIIFALKDTPLGQWNVEQRRTGERVVHSYDQVGTMIKAGMFDKELIVDSWGNSLRRIQPILMPLVIEYRIKWDAHEVWDGFEWLCKEAFHYQTKHKRDQFLTPPQNSVTEYQQIEQEPVAKPRGGLTNNRTATQHNARN